MLLSEVQQVLEQEDNIGKLISLVEKHPHAEEKWKVSNETVCFVATRHVERRRPCDANTEMDKLREELRGAKHREHSLEL